MHPRPAHVSVLLASAVLLAACSGEERAPVRTAEVGRETVAEVVEAPATVEARASATVSAAADGRVAVLRVREGSRVRAGQVLLRIESPQARAALRRAEDADADA
ncbi:MAG: biotin/lipoyl-binding protein, partial [Actinomycetota bacterium]|nr:biotin/lipoyl-binding protein [Actinomycetota bacterium]